MEVPITPSVSLELVDNAIQNIRNRYNQWLGDRHFAKEPEANSGTKTKDIGSKNSGSKTTKTLDEELNLIKLQEAEYKKLQAQYDKNIGDLGAQNDLRYKMLEIEREIFRLRYGADISLKNLPDAKNLNMDNIPGLPFDYTKMKHKYADGVDPRPDMTSEEFQAMIAAEEEKGRMMLANTSAMWENFQGMLQSTGLMKGDFAEIINIINSIISGGKSAFGFFDALGGLLGFLPGGGAVSSVIGGLSGGNGGGSANMSFNGGSLPNIAMPERSAPNVTLLLNTKLEKIDSYRVLVDGKEIEAKIGNSQILT